MVTILSIMDRSLRSKDVFAFVVLLFAATEELDVLMWEPLTPVMTCVCFALWLSLRVARDSTVIPLWFAPKEGMTQVSRHREQIMVLLDFNKKLASSLGRLIATQKQ
jgi:hypothetical protein